ncbi:MAG: GIY-YIG nuclease family protein [Candidatus Omnitrophica bacterium]|nr:GIY-YIG nuclease family protein [Candidatus Omnitrophota bacterium]
MWHIYILRCNDGTLYTGSTTDIDRRLKEHNRRKGGAYTRSRLPVTLMYKEDCADQSTALKREAEIKRLTRKNKLELIRA